MPRAPLVGMPCDSKAIGLHGYQVAGDKYIEALVTGSGVLPMLIPSTSPPLAARQLLERLDGLFLTGAYSNIEPHRYSGAPSYSGNLHDPARDETSLALIPLAIRMRIPILAVCRGLQEVNVALGGSLHQKVQEVAGLADHREAGTAPLEDQYGPAHPVSLSGELARIAGGSSETVNSLHGQGLDRLAPGLVAEAIAPDGLVEGVRLDSGDTFLLAVQWHPEWKVTSNRFYLGIFQAFGDACRQRAAQAA